MSRNRIGHLAARCAEVGLDFCVLTMFAFPSSSTGAEEEDRGEFFCKGRATGGREEQPLRKMVTKEEVARQLCKPGSKSNTGAAEIEIKWASQKSWQLGRKNEDCSESVSSFDAGAIFRPRSGQDLSRNTFVVFVSASQKNLSWRICFL